MPWERFEHEADVGVRGLGVTREEAFAQAAVALTSVVTDPAAVREDRRVEVACEAPDDELLLVDWLNAVIYAMATQSVLFARYEVRIAETKLLADAWGETVDVARHRPAVEIKAATYNSLQVGMREDGRWVAQCVLDV